MSQDIVASITRRDVLKAQAVAVAAAAAGITLPASAQPVAGGVGALKIKWSKAPCRFCGTGCGVMVGVKDGQLKQWTVTDPQGYDTTIAVYNLDSSKKVDPGLFKIDFTNYITPAN